MVRRNGEKRGGFDDEDGGREIYFPFIDICWASFSFAKCSFVRWNEFRMIFPVQGEHRRYPWSEKRGKWEPFWLEITWELNHWRLSKQNLFRGKNLFHNNKNNNNQLVLFIILSFVLLVAIVPRQDCFSEKCPKDMSWVLQLPAKPKTGSPS